MLFLFESLNSFVNFLVSFLLYVKMAHFDFGVRNMWEVAMEGSHRLHVGERLHAPTDNSNSDLLEKGTKQRGE
jgi:hypothetical protein